MRAKRYLTRRQDQDRRAIRRVVLPALLLFAGYMVMMAVVAVASAGVPAGPAFGVAKQDVPRSPDDCLYSEIEPNDAITSATSLPDIAPAQVSGGITPGGDVDYFSFQANAGDRIWSYVVTNEAAPSTDSILTLLNSSGAVLQLDDDNGSQTSLSSAIAGAPITQTGTYLLQVRQFGGTTIMSPYTLYINRTSGAAVPEVEPNDTLATANPYAFGTVVTGSIPITTDLDYYTFTLAQNEQVVIQVDGDPDRNGTNLSRANQFNPTFDLLDAAGNLIITVDSDSQGGNGGLLSENLVYTNTSAVSTTFAVRIEADPSTPPDDDVGFYNLHIYRFTGAPCAAVTNTPTATAVPPTDTATSTAVPPTSTSTATAVPPTSTSTATAVPPTGTSTATAVPPTGTSTATAVPPTNTRTSTAVPPTNTPPPSATGVPTLTSTPIPTATLCAVQFTDVTPANPFYSYIRCLACRGVVSGYADGTFRPYNNMTRGQLAKVVSNAAGFAEPVPAGQQRFEDVPPSDPFFAFVERVASRGIISGYDCGTAPAGPCVPPGNRPYFRPYMDVLRGQLAKIVAMAAGIDDVVPAGRQTFEDVPGDNPFWVWIEQLAGRGIVSGWNCGAAPAGRCVAPANRPYFLPFEETTRGQVSKVVALAFFPGCSPLSAPSAQKQD